MTEYRAVKGDRVRITDESEADGHYEGTVGTVIDHHPTCPRVLLDDGCELDISVIALEKIEDSRDAEIRSLQARLAALEAEKQTILEDFAQVASDLDTAEREAAEAVPVLLDVKRSQALMLATTQAKEMRSTSFAGVSAEAVLALAEFLLAEPQATLEVASAEPVDGRVTFTFTDGDGDSVEIGTVEVGGDQQKAEDLYVEVGSGFDVKTAYVPSAALAAWLRGQGYAV